MKRLIAYKHVKHEFAERFETGTEIALGTFSTYRKGEGDRVDPLEGRFLFHQIGSRLIKNSDMPENRRILSNMGISAIGCRNLTVSDNLYEIEQRDDYLFCASSEPDFSRSDTDAIFKIRCLHKFAAALIIDNPKLLGKTVAGPVRYGAKSADVTDRGVGPDPFLKSPRLSFERELRVIIERLAGPDWMTVSSPSAQNLIKRVHR